MKKKSDTNSRRYPQMERSTSEGNPVAQRYRRLAGPGTSRANISRISFAPMYEAITGPSKYTPVLVVSITDLVLTLMSL